MNRRTLLKNTALLLGTAPLLKYMDAEALPVKKKYRYGACDWSLGKRSDLAAFEVAKKIGLEGIQVNMGSADDNIKLRDPQVQQAYLRTAKETGIKIASLALGELNKIPYKSDPRTEEWVWDSIDVAVTLDVKVILIAFFGNNDLRNDDAGKKETIARLKRVAPKAESKGITLGLESYLSSAEHLDIMQQVGSKALSVYYDFKNANKAGYDIFKDFKELTREQVCEIHLKEDGTHLGKGVIDWPRVAAMVKDFGYEGWMHIEGALPKGEDVVTAYKQNLRFAQEVF